MPRRFDFWDLVALIAEEISDLAGHSRHNGGVEESIKAGKQECADNHGNEDFHAGIDVALCLVGHNCGLNLDRCGINLVLDFLEHIFYLLTFLFYFFLFLIAAITPTAIMTMTTAITVTTAAVLTACDET